MDNQIQSWLRALVVLIIGLQVVSLATNTNQLSFSDLDAVFAAHEISLDSLANSGYVHLRGGWEWNAKGQQAISRFNDAVIEGAFNGTQLELAAFLNKQAFDFSLDSVAPVQLVAPEKPGWGYLKLTENLSPGPHHFSLRLVNRVGQPFRVRGMATDGSFIETKYQPAPKIMGFGSSTMDFCGVTWDLGQKLGWEVINRGIGGTTVIGQGQFRVASDVLPYRPNVVLVNYGSNDWMAKMPLEQFQTAYTSMLTQIGQGLPESKLVVLGLFPRKGGDETLRVQYNRAIKTAINQANLNSRIRYVEVGPDYNWATDTLDGTHPNPTVVDTKFVPLLLSAVSQLKV